jgi:DNA-binding NarL/FixJ family response regulator
MSTSIEAIIAAFRGQRRTVEAHLDEALLQLRVNNVLALAFYVLWAKGFHAEFFPKPEQAAKVYDELRTLWHETEDRLSVAPGIMSATGFYADRGDAVALTDCAEIVEVIYRENSTEETRATCQGVAAEVAWVRGECSRALDAMQAAVTGYDRLGSPVEMALIRRRFARMLARDNQLRRSAGIRQQAQEIAQKLGLRPFLDLLQQESDAASYPTQASSGETQSPSSGLTPRQRQILALIARGMTDKEIAAFLHLSPRTVEMHVAMALDRLNCRTRSEAATRAAEHGWLSG